MLEENYKLSKCDVKKKSLKFSGIIQMEIVIKYLPETSNSLVSMIIEMYILNTDRLERVTSVYQNSDLLELLQVSFDVNINRRYHTRVNLAQSRRLDTQERCSQAHSVTWFLDKYQVGFAISTSNFSISRKNETEDEWLSLLRVSFPQD